MPIARRLSIHGRVQGVFYREWTVDNARQLGVAGWVRNCPDGTVAAHLEGEEAAVQAMIGRMQAGPPAANVDRVDQEEVAIEGVTSFERR